MTYYINKININNNKKKIYTISYTTEYDFIVTGKDFIFM